MIALIALYSSFPRKKDFIMTPSTHQEIEFLSVEPSKLTNKVKVYFALYDKACNYGQICISIPKDNDSVIVRDMAHQFNFFIDDVLVGYSMTGEYTFWRDYIIFLFKDMPDWDEIVVEFDGKEAKITK